MVLTQTPPSAAAVASEARKFSRAATSPLDFKNGVLERALGRTGSLDRIKSSASFSVPATKVNSGGELRMSLASSGLSSLPAELFQLRFLTSLVLREFSPSQTPRFIYLPARWKSIDYASAADIQVGKSARAGYFYQQVQVPTFRAHVYEPGVSTYKPQREFSTETPRAIVKTRRRLTRCSRGIATTRILHYPIAQRTMCARFIRD